MNEPLGVFHAFAVLAAMVAAWACHKAGLYAPSPRGLAWHAISVLLLLRAVNGAMRLYVPEWRPIELYVTPVLLIITSLTVAMLARSFVIARRAAAQALSNTHLENSRN